MIRKATIHDVKAIHRLLKEFADQGKLLPRALSDLYDCIRDFTVFEEKEGNSLIGACALRVSWEDLAEIRSLVVRKPYQRQGIGAMLISKALNEALGLGIKRVFTLTYEPGFFGKHGFEVIDKALLPQKIWADCIKCIKFPDCDEIAMLKSLIDTTDKRTC